jgi:HTH-type transcriptional regulator, competence development regulator
MEEPMTRQPAKATPAGDDASSLGEYLASTRAMRGLSLRAVEEATGKEVSNAYLSQLEKGHVTQPHVNILYHLSDVYAVPYELLMQKAGYIIPTSQRKDDKKHGRAITSSMGNLTKDEEEELMQYLAFIRSKKKGSK